MAVALEMLRHHRLIELFLSELLGVACDRVPEEADRLEHVLIRAAGAALELEEAETSDYLESVAARRSRR